MAILAIEFDTNEPGVTPELIDRELRRLGLLLCIHGMEKMLEQYRDEYFIRVRGNDVGVISVDEGTLFEDETDL